MLLQDMTWDAVRGLPVETPVVFPVAALEQHGRHMPLFTDSMLLGEVVRRASERFEDRALFAPLQWLGNSDHHLDFPGTLSAPPRVYLDLLAASLENFMAHGFRRLLLLNGHGGNIVPIQQVVFEVRQKHRTRDDLLLLGATYWTLGAKPHEAGAGIDQDRMGHACEWETSMMLRLAPRLVGDPTKVEAVPFGNPFEPASRGWITRERTGPGHIGDPRGATAEKGETLFRLFADDVSHLLERMIAWDGRSLGRMNSERTQAWRWSVCGLLLLATMLNYMDRQTLSQSATDIGRELGLSNEEYGRLELVFGLAFAAGGLVLGSVADRVDLRFLYPAVLLAWSAAGFATGSARGYNDLLICRGLLGFFEAGQWPCALAASQRLLPRRDRALGNSLIQSGASIGAILTPLVVQAMVSDEAGSWRGPFRVIGSLGIVWIFGWRLLVGGGDLDRAEEHEKGAPEISTGDRATFVRRFAVLAVVVVSINLCWHFYRAWLPKMLREQYGYSRDFVNYYTSLFYIATDVGCLAAGFAVRALSARGGSVHGARVTAFLVCAGIVGIGSIAVGASSGWLMLGVFLLIGAGALGLFPIYYSLSQELSSRHQGKVTGSLGCVAWLSSALMHAVVGRRVDQTGSYRAALLATGLLPLAALAILALFWERSSRAKPEPVADLA